MNHQFTKNMPFEIHAKLELCLVFLNLNSKFQVTNDVWNFEQKKRDPSVRSVEIQRVTRHLKAAIPMMEEFYQATCWYIFWCKGGRTFPLLGMLVKWLFGSDHFYK